MVPPFRGNAQGNAQGNQNLTRTQGGVSHPPLPFFAVVVRLFVLRPADPNRASGEGKDGSDPPPFSPLARHGEGRGITPGLTPGLTPLPRLRGGRSRLHVSLRKGSPARTRAGR